MALCLLEANVRTFKNLVAMKIGSYFFHKKENFGKQAASIVLETPQ